MGAMTTLPLRKLLRRPAPVKKLTAAGQSVQITDHGKPLWIIHGAAPAGPEPAGPEPAGGAEHAEWMDAEVGAMLAERKSKVSAAQLVLEARE